MTQEEIKTIRDEQRAYFDSGATLSVDNRIDALKRLYEAIKENQEELQDALKSDLKKSAFESDMCEIGLTLSEITYMIDHVRRFSKEKRVRTPLSQFCSRSYTLPMPYGTVLVISPWNYPALLSLEPLVDALASGNTCIIKPSAYSPNTSKILHSIISKTFPKGYVAVIEGGREENKALLDQDFDYIFFTGSKAVGHEVMRKASEHITPLTLELGGKSPCIVERSANIKLAARRIVFGKFLNSGQTCVAPDYILVDNKIRTAFIDEVKKEIVRQYGEKPLENKNYTKIINQKHFDRISALIDPDKVIFGGKTNPHTLQIEPTVIDSVLFSDKIMQEEIFGPLMPIISYDSIDDAIMSVKRLDHPLAFYVFSENKKLARNLMRSVGFGGGCINDTVIHIATSYMGFGGFKESGIGSYHGKTGFDAFSHYKNIVDKKTWLDLPMRYSPYKRIYHKLIKLFLR